jgi:PPOX class probable F420-dependent enzyme
MDSEISGVPWEHIERQLRNTPNYWVCTTRADGRPHAMPVWGVWHERALWFGTGRESVKGRNLARDPRCVVHLDSGDDVVILEGRVEREPAPDAVYARYRDKYVMEIDAASMEAMPQTGAMYRLAPERLQAWLEAFYVQSAIRYRFDAGGAPVADGRPAIPV